MIGKINIKISAANPQMPLGPFHVFAGSAASFTICDIPLPLGVRRVEGVSVQVKNVGGETRGFAAVRVGSAWGVTVPAGFFAASGSVEKGLVISAAGHDDNGEDVTSWKLGAGDVFVMLDDGSVAPGEVRQDLEWFDTVPESPRPGYVAPVEGVVCVYRGGEWVPLGSQGDVRSADFQDIPELEPGDSSGTIKERFNQMLRKIKGTVAALAAVACFAAWAELGPDTIMDDVPGTNTIGEVVRAAGVGGAVDSVNGKTGTVELVASDVHALPDTYTPPAAPVQSVNGKTGSVVLNADDVGAWDSRYEVGAALKIGYLGRMFSEGTAPYELSWDADEKRFKAKWEVGEIPTSDYLALLGDLNRFVPTTRKVNGQPLTQDISIEGMADNAAVLTNGELRTKSGTSVTPAAIGAASSGSVAEIQGQIGTLNAGYTRLYNFNTGATNANFTATNYPPTKAEADARCHWQPEDGMDFTTVPASLQLNEFRDGEWRTVVDARDWTVWYYKFKEVQLTNELARLRAENAVLSNEVANAKAWAGHTANGIENPLDDTVVVDRPNMWLMADYEWQKCVSGSNQCFVLRAKNVALSGGANTNGFLEVCDAFGKPYMRINKSSETFADPVFEDIYFDDDEGAWYVVYANTTKPTKGGANVALRGNGSGKCILYGEDDEECPAVITWPNVPESVSGHWIMKAVPKPVNGVVPDKMFFGAEIRVPGSDYVEYLKEASFSAGIRFGANVYDPVESGDQLIWIKRQ